MKIKWAQQQRGRKAKKNKCETPLEKVSRACGNCAYLRRRSVINRWKIKSESSKRERGARENEQKFCTFDNEIAIFMSRGFVFWFGLTLNFGARCRGKKLHKYSLREKFHSIVRASKVLRILIRQRIRVI